MKDSSEECPELALRRKFVEEVAMEFNSLISLPRTVAGPSSRPDENPFFI